jgi:hypothetical protein
MRTFQSRGAKVVLLVAIAFGFFFAGYCARAIRVAEAASTHPIVTPPPPDGNPVGHRLNPPKHLAAPPGLLKCLNLLKKHPIAIVYQLAPPNKPPYRPKPTCSGQAQPCVEFVWRNMTIQTLKYDGTDNKPSTVDVWGTLSN